MKEQDGENYTMNSYIICISSPIIIMVTKLMRIRWVGNVACMGEMQNVYIIVAQKPEGKRLLRR
jgi:hypothetical protein